MGWFDEQIKTRIEKDSQEFEDAVIDLSSVILGKQHSSATVNNERVQTQNAIEEILKYYKSKIIELPNDVEGFSDQLEYMLKPTGIMYRNVKLNGKWWKDAIGPMIGRTASGEVIALLPYGIGHYRYYDYKTGKHVSLSSKNMNLIKPEAICFYKPLPLKPLKIKDLLWYSLSALSKADLLMIVATMIFGNLIGLLVPMVNKTIYQKVVPLGESGLNFLAPVLTFLLVLKFLSI